MDEITLVNKLSCKAEYDIIVAGGGVAGVAAALTARRRGCRVLLLEKSNILGGLATLGLVNCFVAMCNGRGHQIIFGLADEWIDECARYGFSTMPQEWRDRKDGVPSAPTQKRLHQHYSPNIFAMQMTEMIRDAGVDLLFDCIASEPVMEGRVCRGIVTESKSGREFYAAKVVIDTTGDADILRRSGMPTVKGQNYYSYFGKLISLETCREAVESGDIGRVYRGISGGGINLYGHNQPADKPRWSGTTVEEVSDYLIDNQLAMLNKLKADEKPQSRDVAMLPQMPNFRTTCRIDGDYALREEDIYRHFDDSICAVNDFDHRDALYEIPLRCLTRKGWDNLITAGRSAAAQGYAWDVIRVIPPAILTGQAASEAAALSIESGVPVAEVDIATLQARLERDDHIMIHFPDEYVPQKKGELEFATIEGHV